MSAISPVSDRPSHEDRLNDGPRFTKFINRLSAFCGWAASAMILAAVSITCQMIFVRFVLNASTVWQTEAVIYLIIAATLIGLPFVQHMRGHVNVDLIPLLLPFKARFYLAIATHLISDAVILIMFFYGIEYWYQAYSKGWTSDTVWAVRLWIPYLALPIGFGVLFLQLTADLLAIISKHDTPFNLGDA